MNILFLDFDGVLNSKQHFLMIKNLSTPPADTLNDADLFSMKRNVNANNMWALKYILDNIPDLKIVISSAWRNYYELEQFKELFKLFGLDESRIISKTPKKFSSERCHEVRMWLDDYIELHHKQVDFLAVDDHTVWDLTHEFKAREILTDGWMGLTMQDAFRIIKHFNPEFKEPNVAI